MTERPGAGAGRAGEGLRPVTQLVAATANPDKLAELNALLTGAGIEVLPRPASVPDVVEDGDSLEANARLKADAAAADARADEQEARADGWWALYRDLSAIVDVAS